MLRKMKHTHIRTLVQDLKKTAAEKKAPLWKRVAEDLNKPTSKRRVVNLSRIDRYANAQDTVLVPGKVLSMGDLTKKVTVVAYQFSGKAREKIESSGSKTMTITELMEKNPKGAKVRIFG